MAATRDIDNKLQNLFVKARTYHAIELQNSRSDSTRISLILLDAWNNFPRYFNSMEEKDELMDAIKTELKKRNIIVEHGDNFYYIDRDKVMSLKTAQPFSFSYQMLRLRLFHAAPLIPADIERFNRFFPIIDTKTQSEVDEKAKLSKMNFLIIKNYLVWNKRYPQSRLTHALKSYIQNPPYSPLDTFAFKSAYELMKYVNKRRGALTADEERIKRVEKLAEELLAAKSYQDIQAKLDKVYIPSNSTLSFTFKKMLEKANRYADYEKNAPRRPQEERKPNRSQQERNCIDLKKYITMDTVIRNSSKDIQTKNFLTDFKKHPIYKKFEDAEKNYAKDKSYENTMKLHKAAAELKSYFDETYASSSQFSWDEQPFRAAYRKLHERGYFGGLNNLINDCETDLQNASYNSAKRLFTIIMIALNKVSTNRDKTVLINKMREVMSSNKPDNTKYAELREELDKTIHQVDKTYFGKPVFFAGYKIYGSRLRIALEEVKTNQGKIINIEKSFTGRR